MNRSGYSDDWDGSQEDNWNMIRWRGAVKSSIRGRRGQAFLIELRDALDSMEDKRLVSEDLEADGQHCALGVVLSMRGVDMAPIQAHLGEYDPEWGYEGGDEDAYWDDLSHTLNIAGALAREIMFINDESYSWRDYRVQGPANDPSKRRWQAVRNWVESQIQSADGRRSLQRGSNGDTDVDPGTGAAGSTEDA